MAVETLATMKISVKTRGRRCRWRRPVKVTMPVETPAKKIVVLAVHRQEQH
jgi:hypothetical protein